MISFGSRALAGEAPSPQTIEPQASKLSSGQFPWVAAPIRYGLCCSPRLIGFIVGILAKAIMPGKDPGGFIITVLLGIAGSFLASFLGRSMGWYAPGATAGFLASIVGAIVLLALYRMVIGRRHLPA